MVVVVVVVGRMVVVAAVEVEEVHSVVDLDELHEPSYADMRLVKIVLGAWKLFVVAVLVVVVVVVELMVVHFALTWLSCLISGLV